MQYSSIDYKCNEQKQTSSLSATINLTNKLLITVIEFRFRQVISGGLIIDRIAETQRQPLRIQSNANVNIGQLGGFSSSVSHAFISQTKETFNDSWKIF